MEKIDKKILWAILGIIILNAIFKNDKPPKPYHSEVYSSWEEEKIDELECDVAYLLDKLEKKS